MLLYEEISEWMSGEGYRERFGERMGIVEENEIELFVLCENCWMMRDSWGGGKINVYKI